MWKAIVEMIKTKLLNLGLIFVFHKNVFKYSTKVNE